jgi:hypothetical protein
MRSESLIPAEREADDERDDRRLAPRSPARASAAAQQQRSDVSDRSSSFMFSDGLRQDMTPRARWTSQPLG